jgi:energy-coupling factor transporter ATP-binding protein EcfA2
MAIEEQIIQWSSTRPAWQRAVLRRVATGDHFSNADYDELVVDLLAPKQAEAIAFSLAELPQVDLDDPPVALVSMAELKHVNALASEGPLTFEPTGLNIVYGDNGSGKSGYARLLKRIARARHREEVLSDVFRDTALAEPNAALTVKVGDEERSLAWPDSTVPELQRMLFYDEACGRASASSEFELPYRPSALFVMDGLIEACVAIRARIDSKLEVNAKMQRPMPMVDEAIRETDVGKYLTKLSGDSSLETLDSLLQERADSAELLHDLKGQEARLQSTDWAKQTGTLTREADKLESIRTHLIGLHAALGDDALGDLEEERRRLRVVGEAADLLAEAFQSEPLPGVGTSPWRELWEAGRRFSETHAYPDDAYPVAANGSKCVLCQQTLDEDARQRLSRFERFVQDDTQERLRASRAKWVSRLEGLDTLSVTSESVETNLRDLEAEHAESVREVRLILAEYEDVRVQAVNALKSGGLLSRRSPTPHETTAELAANAAAARTEAGDLSNPTAVREKLAAVTAKRKELELLQEVKNVRDDIADEVRRLKEREDLETAKGAAATGPITQKIVQLSEDSITEVLRDTFTRETERLRLERVTIAKTRADRGAVLHQPKLVGARQNVTLPRVFSEGERTALGLAAFFTEAQLDASQSALILDDPVSSLDHIRRGLVAARLAAFAEARQVIVFTHDVSLVADLKREAKGLGVPVVERSVTRGRRGERKPGVSSAKHPWKAKDVPERLGELRSELARIKRDCGDWDESTYEDKVAMWAGNLSESWERIFSQEVVGPILAEGGLEVRPNMVKILAYFSVDDDNEFQASYSRVSQWAKRHDKSRMVNYVAPEIATLEEEFERVNQWFKRVKGYKNKT